MMSKIQSLSVVVPNKKCINNCKFCVAHMHTEDYEDMISGRNLYFDLYWKDFKERLQYARDNGCNSMMLTGNSEPQQNWQFLQLLGIANKEINNPFKQIEIQTTGVLLDDAYLYFLRHHVGVSTISLSISSFNNGTNARYCQMPIHNIIDIKYLCSRIKQYRFNLRISINLTDSFNEMNSKKIINYCKNDLKANQITFRVLYNSNDNTPQDQWIKEHKANDKLITSIKNYIKSNGKPLEKLEFGQTRYAINEMSIVLDDDCMSTEVKEAMKYVILRPDCKLYSKWNDKGSLIF